MLFVWYFFRKGFGILLYGQPDVQYAIFRMKAVNSTQVMAQLTFMGTLS